MARFPTLLSDIVAKICGFDFVEGAPKAVEMSACLQHALSKIELFDSFPNWGYCVVRIDYPLKLVKHMDMITAGEPKYYWKITLHEIGNFDLKFHERIVQNTDSNLFKLSHLLGPVK